MILKFNFFPLLLVLVSLSCTSVRKLKANNITNTFITNQPITNSSHAATLVEFEPNKLMAAWFGGKYEGAKDVGIYFAVYKDKKWSEPLKLVTPLIIQNDGTF
jgi:predicted neuraminidase